MSYTSQFALQQEILRQSAPYPYLEAVQGLRREIHAIASSYPVPLQLTAILESAKPIFSLAETCPDSPSLEGRLKERRGSVEKAFSQLQEPCYRSVKIKLCDLLNSYDEVLQELHEKGIDFVKRKYQPMLATAQMGYRLLSSETLGKLVPMSTDGEITSSIVGGSRPVNRAGNIFWKVKPTAPLQERLVFWLRTLVCNTPSPATDIAKVASFRAQASRAVEGMNFHTLLLEHREWLMKLDPLNYGFSAVEQGLELPQDSKPNNFIAVLEKLEGNVVNVKIVGIDNDLPFAHPVCLQKDFHHLNVRSILFSLPQVYTPIHPEVREYYRRLNYPAALLKMLNEARRDNQNCMQLKVAGIFTDRDLEKMQIPLKFLPETIPTLIWKLKAIRQFMEESPPEATYMDLLKQIIPEIAYLQDIVNHQHLDDPLEAFMKIFVGGGPNYEAVMGDLFSMELAQGGTLGELVARSSHHSADFETMRSVLPEHAAALLLHDLDFNEFSSEQQREIIAVLKEFPLDDYSFQGCSTLSDDDVQFLVMAHPSIQRLSFNDCPQLTDAILEKLALVRRDLFITVENCMGISPSKCEELIPSFRHFSQETRQIAAPSQRSLVQETHAVAKELQERLKDLKALLAWLRTLDPSQKPTAILKLVEEIKARKLMDRIVIEGGAEGLQAFFAWGLSCGQTNTQSETWAHVAARLGKADVLATAAASGVSLDAVDTFGYTPLLRAVRENHLDCVQFLIGKVDLNVKLKWTLTPVQMALEEKKAPIALALIQQPSVELTGVTVKNETLLHLVMMQKDLPLLKAFLEHNQDQAQALNREGACPLTVGIEEGSFECVQHLASAMKSVDVPSPKGVTPLMVAAGKGKAAVVKFLLSKGANPKAVDQEGMAAVHYAARGGSVEVLELFSDLIQLARKDGRQPLHLAASQGMLAAAAHLLDKKAPFLACDERGWTAAHVAAAFGKWEILALFKARGLNIDISDNPAKETPLMIALEAAQFTCVRWLKTEEASFEAVDQRGWNPLQRCILGHQLQAVCFLFDEIKLDPAEISQTKKVAPLHLAASSGAEALVQELLRRKVPVDPLDRNGKTPLILAIQSGHGTCTRLLVAAGANVAFEMKDGYTTLHYASDPSLVEYILSMHPELVSKRTREEGHTPLHRVMYQSHEHLGEVIRLLIRYGADVNAPDNYQYVALHLAAKNGQDQIVKILLELGARTDLRNANGRTPAEHASYMAEKASDELRARILTTKALIEEHEKGSKKSLGKGTGLFGSLKDRRKKEIEEQKRTVLAHVQTHQGYRLETLKMISLMAGLSEGLDSETLLQGLEKAKRSSEFAMRLPVGLAAYSEAALIKALIAAPDAPFAKDFDVICGALYRFEDLLKLAKTVLFPGIDFNTKTKKLPSLASSDLKALVALLQRWFTQTTPTVEDCRALEEFAKAVGLKELKPLWKTKGVPLQEKKVGEAALKEALRLFREVETGINDPARYAVRLDQAVAALWSGYLEAAKKMKLSEASRGTCTPILQRDQALVENAIRLILESDEPAQRVRMLTFFIHVADACCETRHFHAAHVLQVALNQPAMVRLKGIWQGLSGADRQKKGRLDKLFSPQFVYGEYAEALENHYGPLFPSLRLFPERIRILIQPKIKGTQGELILQSVGSLFQVCQQFIEQQGLLAKVIVPQSQEAQCLQSIFSSELFPGLSPTYLQHRSCALEKLKF